MKECRICKAGMLGIKWSLDVVEGKKSAKQMAEFFGVTVEEVWRHVEEHLRPEEVRRWVEEDDEIMGKMRKIVRVLEDYVDLLADAYEPDVGKIRALTGVVKELRSALMDYAELAGRIQRGQIVVQVQQVEKRVQELTMVVLEECCEECRERILRRLEAFQ